MLRFIFYFLLSGVILLVAAIGGVLWWVGPQLPPIDALSEVQLQTPLRVFSKDGALIAEFGEKRRDPVSIDAVPDQVKHAFIAAEDERFYEHPGVDWVAIARAGLELAQTRTKRQGGSTITMQVARNFFLSPEKTYVRKLKEIVLALKIERELSKDEIFELYLNKIFLGQRAYGVATAAHVYYGVPLHELSVAQVATIAGLPKAPSRMNPVTDPAAAKERRAYVLRRMLELGFIDQRRFDEALVAPETARLHGLKSETEAPYLAEMVREAMQEKYGELAYSSGLRVYTTISVADQTAAVGALRAGLMNYDERHGYRGAEASIDIEGVTETELDRELWAFPELGGLRAGVVTKVDKKSASIRLPGETITVDWDGLSWARPYRGVDKRGSNPKSAGDVVSRGDVVRVQQLAPQKPQDDSRDLNPAGRWRLAQIPEVEGALVALDTHDGAILALVGGFDFDKSKFNRVTQARRQPGSNFKPFIYSAAIENGFTPASFINDAPIVFETPGLEAVWRPENYSGKYFGPTRLREALAKSRNLVSIRLMRSMGIDKTVEHVTRFGFQEDKLPRNLSLSLGSGELTPLELASAYAVLANGGFRVEPYFIERIEREDGEVEFQAAPATVCERCEPHSTRVSLRFDEPEDLNALRRQQDQMRRPAARTLDAQNAYIMYSMLKDVIARGTGRQAKSLGRTDLAGKTGTTNDQKDAWFSGFNRDVTATAWVGFDDFVPLGKRETGSKAALPIWIDFMGAKLAGAAAAEPQRPPGLVTVKIDPRTGMLANAGIVDAFFETFKESNVPRFDAASVAPSAVRGGVTRAKVTDQLF